MHDAVQEGNIRAHLDLREDIGFTCQSMFARIRDNQLGAIFQRLFDEVGGNGMRLGHVGARQEEQFCVFEFAERICHCARTKGGCQTGNSGSVSDTGAVVNVVRPYRLPE